MYIIMDEKKCKIEFKPDKILGWKLGLSGNCEVELTSIEGLPPGKKEYLKRRLDHSSESSSISSS